MTIFARRRAALAAGWGGLSIDRYHIVARHSNTALMCLVMTMLIAGMALLCTARFLACQFPWPINAPERGRLLMQCET